MIPKELAEMLKRMMKERAVYWYTQHEKFHTEDSLSTACAYNVCAHLVELALNGDIEQLNQFDYYHED